MEQKKREKSDVNRKKMSWTLAAKYVSGMLVLAVSVTAALLFPQWYYEWQDRQILDEVTLEQRENIQFLDTASLDIAGRMRILSETKGLGWSQSWGDGFASEAEAVEFLERCRRVMQTWYECGLISPRCVRLLDTETLMNNQNFYVSSSMSYIYTEQNYIPVLMMRVYGHDEVLSLLADAEVEVIYYVSYSSEAMADRIAQMGGYETVEQFEQAIRQAETTGTIIAREDYSDYDFASVCKAESAAIVDQSCFPELELELTYENFTAPAYRSTVDNSGLFGICYMFGSRDWGQVMTEVAEYYGYQEVVHDWKQMLLEAGADSGKDDGWNEMMQETEIEASDMADAEKTKESTALEEKKDN